MTANSLQNDYLCGYLQHSFFLHSDLLVDASMPVWELEQNSSQLDLIQGCIHVFQEKGLSVEGYTVFSLLVIVLKDLNLSSLCIISGLRDFIETIDIVICIGSRRIYSCLCRLPNFCWLKSLSSLCWRNITCVTTIHGGHYGNIGLMDAFVCGRVRLSCGQIGSRSQIR